MCRTCKLPPSFFRKYIAILFRYEFTEQEIKEWQALLDALR